MGILDPKPPTRAELSATYATKGNDVFFVDDYVSLVNAFGTTWEAAINAAITAAGSNTVRFKSKLYKTSAPIELPVNTPVSLMGEPGTQIQAVASMSSVIHKPAGGSASGSRINGLIVDANRYATYALDVEQCHRMTISNSQFLNALNTVMAFGRTGSQCYEMLVEHVRVIGLDNGRAGAIPTDMPAYGYTLGSNTTDNVFREVISKNSKVYGQDDGIGNVHEKEHGFGYPLNGIGGTVDWVADVGYIIGGSNNRFINGYLDNLVIGLRISGSNSAAVGNLHGYASSWAYTGTIIGVDVTANNATVINNKFSLNSSASYSGYPIRVASGVLDLIYSGNNVIGGAKWLDIGQWLDGLRRGYIAGNRFEAKNIPEYMNYLNISGRGDNGEIFLFGGAVPGRIKTVGSGATGWALFQADTSGAGVLLGQSTNKLGFLGATPVAKPSLTYGQITESAAAAALRTAFAAYGLVTDSTTAPAIPSGSYVHLNSPTTSSTSATLGNGSLRTTPVMLPAISIARIGAEITSAGSAGCVLRLGIYADNGSGQPGTLIQDFGTIAADAVALPEITLGTPLALAAGLYHIGAVLQGAPATQPTVRTASIPDVPQGVLIPMGTSIPAANTSVVGNSMSSVTGALPSTFVVSGGTGSVVRIFAKLA